MSNPKAKSVAVKDVYGDGRHVSIEVVSDKFEGEGQMKRQRMVYKVGWSWIWCRSEAHQQLCLKLKTDQYCPVPVCPPGYLARAPGGGACS